MQSLKKHTKIAPALLTIALLAASTHASAAQSITDRYKAIHATHMQQEVELMFDQIDEANGLTAGIAQKNGFTFPQAIEVVSIIRSKITQCWESSFLASATPQQIETVVTAYDTGKTQFVKKKVPLLRQTLDSCTKNTKQYLQAGINHIYENY
jgi:long-subunit fatty acid transport protein